MEEQYLQVQAIEPKVHQGDHSAPGPPLAGRGELDAVRDGPLILGQAGLLDDDQALAFEVPVCDLDPQGTDLIRHAKRGLQAAARLLRAAGDPHTGVVGLRRGHLDLRIGRLEDSLPALYPPVRGRVLEPAVHHVVRVWLRPLSQTHNGANQQG